MSQRADAFLQFATAAGAALMGAAARTVLAATSPLQDLQREAMLLDMTLPPPGPVTIETVDAVRARAALVAAHAFRVAEEVAARDRHVPLQPQETDHA